MGFLVSACVDVSMNGYIVAVSLAGGVVEEVRGWESVLSGASVSHRVSQSVQSPLRGPQSVTLQSQSVPTDHNACTSHTPSPVFTEGRSHHILPKYSIHNIWILHLQMTKLTFPLRPDNASNEFAAPSPKFRFFSSMIYRGLMTFHNITSCHLNLHFLINQHKNQENKNLSFGKSQNQNDCKPPIITRMKKDFDLYFVLIYTLLVYNWYRKIIECRDDHSFDVFLQSWNLLKQIPLKAAAQVWWLSHALTTMTMTWPRLWSMFQYLGSYLAGQKKVKMKM